MAIHSSRLSSFFQEKLLQGDATMHTLIALKFVDELSIVSKAIRSVWSKAQA